MFIIYSVTIVTALTWSCLQSASEHPWRVMESDSRAEKDRGRGPEEVLIEREGRFELVNACEVQAEGDMSAERGTEPGTLPEAANESRSDNREQLNSLALNSDHESKKSNLEAADYLSSSDHHDPPEKAQGDVSAKSTLSESPLQTVGDTPGAISQGEPVGCGVKPSSAQPGGLKSGSRVQIAATTKGTASPKLARAGKDLSSVSATSLRPRDGSKWKQSASRVQSAPGSRSVRKHKQELEDAEIKKREKREMNEAAFAAWLSRKNEERKKQEKPKNQASEDLEQKRQRNEAAFQAWVASKEQELQEQKERKQDSAPSSRTPQCSKEMSSAAFEGWVSRKKEQRRREAGLEEKRKKEQEEAAKKVDPTIVDQSYKK